MSDEEKKAIDKLKRSANYFVMPIYETKIILELIEKQQKEIEELNKENLEIRDWKYVIDSPIDLDKLKELDLIKIKGKEYVSKDKLKEKIKELNENYILREESEQKEKKAYIDGTNVAHELCNKMWKNKIKAKIEEVSNGTYDAKIVLESLLEKE